MTVNPIEFPRAVFHPRDIPPVKPTWLVTLEKTDDEQEFVLRLDTDEEILTRRVRLQSHAEAEA